MLLFWIITTIFVILFLGLIVLGGMRLFKGDGFLARINGFFMDKLSFSEKIPLGMLLFVFWMVSIGMCLPPNIEEKMTRYRELEYRIETYEDNAPFELKERLYKECLKYDEGVIELNRKYYKSKLIGHGYSVELAYLPSLKDKFKKKFDHQ